jgi:glycosyltransferase involved in cell wall biosynthesis
MAETNKVNIIHDVQNTQNFDAVKKIYSDADFMVFPSRSTTWGMTILESFAMGVPVITTAYAGPREVTAHDFNCLLADYTVQEISNKQLEFLGNIGCRNYMFPPDMSLIRGYWAEPNQASLQKMMSKAYDLSPQHRLTMAQNARVTAENFSWAKGAASLAAVLREVCK